MDEVFTRSALFLESFQCNWKEICQSGLLLWIPNHLHWEIHLHTIGDGEGMIGNCHLTKEIFYADPQFALAQCAVCTCPPTPRNTAALNKQRCFANALNLGSFSWGKHICSFTMHRVVICVLWGKLCVSRCKMLWGIRKRETSSELVIN